MTIPASTTGRAAHGGRGAEVMREVDMAGCSTRPRAAAMTR